MAGTPAWAAVVAAAVAALAGLGAGASAAAVITTRHERVETFRNRMIEAADKVVTRLVGIGYAASTAERLIGESAGGGNLDAALEPIRNAQWFHGEAESELARLYVIFPDPIAAELAEAAGTAMQKWIDALKDVLKPADSDEYASAVTRAHFAATEAKTARDRLLREMNRQIRNEGRLSPLRPRRGQTKSSTHHN